MALADAIMLTWRLPGHICDDRPTPSADARAIARDTGLRQDSREAR
jgi:hypothetical protein